MLGQTIRQWFANTAVKSKRSRSRHAFFEELESRRLLAADLLLGSGTDKFAAVGTNEIGMVSSVAAASGTLRFAMLGDFGTNNTAEADVAAMVAAQSPEIIVTAGDNRYGNLTFQQAVGDHYGQYIAAASGGTSPVNRFFPSTGNHDYFDGGGISEYLAYFDLPGTGVTSTNTSGTERYYDVIEGPVHFFFVDSQEAISNAADRTAQQTWLQTQMSASTAAWQIVLLHHPPYSSALHGSTTVMQWDYAAWARTQCLLVTITPMNGSTEMESPTSSTGWADAVRMPSTRQLVVANSVTMPTMAR